ncbi:MAG TPA: endolytic transglycosylase MltG [Bacteroidia bacterium]|nr:endolytic transglycosylase MltG [Bacteroidia bacterium]
MGSKKKSWLAVVIKIVLITVLIVGGIGGYLAYRFIYMPNINLKDKKSTIIYIPTGSSFEDVVSILNDHELLKDSASFKWLAKEKKYDVAVKPGKYRVLAKMNNSALINLLRLGKQEAIEINFSGLHTVDEFIARVGRRIEADSNALSDAVNNEQYIGKYGFTKDNIQTFFIPGEYEFYWNTSVDEFFQRMAKEYKAFWNTSRKQRAKAIGLSQTEVYILASIVQGEQCCDKEEKKTIAGLYINRLKKGMPLQSDPTVIFAIGNFNIQRVTTEQIKSTDSRYNTYQHEGLPPGPIGFAQESSIDAVLNYIPSDYIYMCAKDDLTGKHCFSKTFEQHKIYAKKYWKALDDRGIH